MTKFSIPVPRMRSLAPEVRNVFAVKSGYKQLALGSSGARAGRPWKRYVFSDEDVVAPKKIVFPLPGTAEKDFLVIPDFKMMTAFPALSQLHYSESLKHRYQYLGGSEMELYLPEMELRVEGKFSVDLVGWNNSSTAQFPKLIHMVDYRKTNGISRYKMRLIPGFVENAI